MSQDIPKEKTPETKEKEITDHSSPSSTSNVNLRPNTLKDFIGQKDAMTQLDVVVNASKKSSNILHHILIEGPPGLGKTTIAQAVAKDLNKPIRISSGPVLEKPHQIVSLLSKLTPGEIIFIDEIHRIPKSLEEYLYSAMEDFVIDIEIETDTGTKPVRVKTPPFTLIGATTLSGQLSVPMLTRFPLTLHLNLYSESDLSLICNRNLTLLDIKTTKDVCDLISSHSRGTPRILNNHIKFIHSLAINNDIEELDIPTTQEAFSLLKVGPHGLTERDTNLLKIIYENYSGGPVGVKTLSATSGIDEQTILTVLEPFLLTEGYLLRTGKGRKTTDKANKLFEE